MLNERIAALKSIVTNKEHVKYRRLQEVDLSGLFDSQELSLCKRTVRRLAHILSTMPIYILPEETIVGAFTNFPKFKIVDDGQLEKMWQGRHAHEKGVVNNIAVNYEHALRLGLEGLKQEAEQSLQRYRELNAHAEQDFLESAIEGLDAVMNFARRYAEKARELAGALEDPAQQERLRKIAEVCERVPGQSARNFREAVQSFYFLHMGRWAEGHYHCCIGRFDQFMLPYLEHDLQAGLLTRSEALELLEELWLKLNWDTDLFHGLQQGDNGQSMMLGGVNRKGEPAENELTELCLEATSEIRMIDPKINLRVSKHTPDHLLIKAAELTQLGLGFPQYENDQAIIEGLVRAGYEQEDARDFTVAACWEYIIPGKGMDIPNISAVNFLRAVEWALDHGKSQVAGQPSGNDYGGLADYASFAELMAACKKHIVDQVRREVARTRATFLLPGPFQSCLMDDCLASGKDVSEQSKYHNYGFHGVGLANAADALCAMKCLMYDTKRISTPQLRRALDENFEGHEELRRTLIEDAPKFGNDNDAVRAIAHELTRCFAEELKRHRNDRGGIYRGGISSALLYIWQGKEIGATPDGRKAQEPLAPNFSPVMGRAKEGLTTVIRTFAQHDLTDMINGGPLTIEIHDSAFQSSDAFAKMAALIRTYVELGGLQVQVNAVNRKALLDAQAHPERYRDLIVRVWGFSAYFVELERDFQDHIISRTEHMFN